jgi:hypothetical protein
MLEASLLEKYATPNPILIMQSQSVQILQTRVFFIPTSPNIIGTMHLKGCTTFTGKNKKG